MTEQLILSYLKLRLEQLKYSRYHLRYRDFSIEAGKQLIVDAYTDLYFIIDDPHNIIVESDFGTYDTTGEYIFENSHEHKGEIRITNPDSENKRIKFIQVIIIN